MRIRLVLVAAFLLLAGRMAAEALAAPDDEAPTITVLGARVEPLKMRPGGAEPKGKPWDADHKAIPNFVYRTLGPVVGLPPLAVFALIPYRNRPDPYVVVRTGDEEIARSRPVRGAFAPAWRLTLPLPPPDERGPTIEFEVFDDDIQDDDRVGQATAEIATLLAQPGARRLEGTGGLHDVTLVVRNPSAPGAKGEVAVTVSSVTVKVRKNRPAGGDWDAGGNPLTRKFRRLPVPEKLRGLKNVPPDLRIQARWGASESRTSPAGEDAFELVWKDVDWPVTGRPGTGDGLLLEVIDIDLLVADPVGLTYVPLEDFVAAEKKGVLVVEPDEWSGVERIEIAFSLRDPAAGR